jgi:CheY-like chemotaxis protein/anti-sigma regulatory factor (Ser/Thr protein kinase)
MREMLARSLRGDIDIDIQVDAQLWPVEVDPGELELAVLNLCVNARDAMQRGGTILIEARNVVEAGRDGAVSEMVRLTVTDTGCGMPPEVLVRVLEPFFTTKDVGKGSGLGLPQVYGFAQQSGGQLHLASEVDVGTVVTLRLPRSLGEPSPRDHVGSSHSGTGPTALRNGVVLLVEDDREVAALTREMLAGLGFAVIHVASPAAALGALADGRTVDVVFSDIMMPGGMNGLDLAREIHRRHPVLPVVLTTGYAESAATMAPGEFRVLLKPYSTTALAEALRVDAR